MRLTIAWHSICICLLIATVNVVSATSTETETTTPPGEENVAEPAEEDASETETDAPQDGVASKTERWVGTDLFIKQGRTFVRARPLLEALGWRHRGGSHPIAFERTHQKLILDLDDQRVSLVTADGEVSRSNQLTSQLRNDRTYVVLRDLAGILNANVAWDQKSGIVTWETDEDVLRLPTHFAPYEKVGVLVTVTNLRGSSPSRWTIHRRIQRAIARAVRDGRCTPVYIDSIAEATERGLPLIVVGAYSESRGDMYHLGVPMIVTGEPDPKDIDAYGTDVECQIYARTPDSENSVVKIPTVYASSPSSVAIRGTSRSSIKSAGASVLRRKAVQRFLKNIDTIVLPACVQLWEEHGR